MPQSFVRPMNTETSHTKTKQQLVPQLRFPEFRGEWPRNKLKDVSQYFNGGSFESDVKESGKYELVTLKSIDTLGNLVSSKRYIDTEVKTLTKDTLVMILSEQAPGLLGMTALIPQNYKYVLNQRIAEIRPNQKIDSYFLSMAINRNQRYFSKMGAGMKVQNISKPNVENYKFFSTEFPEQQKIASFLTAVDTKIQQLTQKKELLEQYKKGVMQQLFSQQLRFKPVLSGVEGQDDGSDYPDWEEKKLGEVLKYYDGTHQTPKYVKDGIPFYSVEHVTSNQFVKTKYISEEVFEKENKRVKLERGDILMTRIGDIGTSRLIDWDVNASFYVSLALLKQNENFNSDYLNQYVSSVIFQKELWKRTIHVAFPKKINLGEIGNCKVQLPTMEEQQKIASYLSALDTKKESVAQQINQTQQFKKGLLQQLFV